MSEPLRIPLLPSRRYLHTHTFPCTFALAIENKLETPGYYKYGFYHTNDYEKLMALCKEAVSKGISLEGRVVMRTDTLENYLNTIDSLPNAYDLVLELLGKKAFQPWYHVGQSNIGGRFIKPATEVFLQAETYEEAKEVFTGLGIDFEDECECCGFRWTNPSLHSNAYEADVGFVGDVTLMRYNLCAVDNVPVVGYVVEYDRYGNERMLTFPNF